MPLGHFSLTSMSFDTIVNAYTVTHTENNNEQLSKIQNMIPFPKVDRVEVIDEKGRSYTHYNAKDVQIHLQDDGRTLKVFLKTKGAE